MREITCLTAVVGSGCAGLNAADWLAALGAEGTTQVTQLRHIRRGYQDMEGTLRQLGADIRLLPTSRDTGEDHGICETQPKAKTPPQPALRAL